jgi:hypothetical protein
VFAELTSWENLFRAFREAARGKRRQVPAATFEHRLEDEIAALRRELQSGTYRPGPYSSFYIREPKRRLISAAPFRDRVVHHALCQVIEPRFERRFSPASFANRRGRGTHRALDACQRYARKFPFVLQLDVRQFFPSIDHEILRGLLARRIPDGRVLGLIDAILASGAGVLSESYDMCYFPGDDLFAVLRPRGLPIGNLTSQFWGNVVLDPIDAFLTRELGFSGYVRYVDDLLVFGNEKSALWQALRAIEERLAGLRMRFHRGSHPRPTEEGIPFLGFVVFPEVRRLKRRNVVHSRRRLACLGRQAEAGDIVPDRAAESVRSWLEHARHGNTVGLRKTIVAACPSALRALLN